MNQPVPNESWRRFAEVLRADGEGSGLSHVFPNDAARCSLLDALARADVAATSEHAERGVEIHEVLTGLLQQLDNFESMSRCPILAVTGLLNAGKSSLLATYLSPVNRGRVLRGLSNRAGTHRFVLWLPKIWWENTELLNLLLSYLTSLFGHAPERLSEDPDEAALQYNGRTLPGALMAPHSAVPAREDSTRETDLARTSPDPLTVPLIAYDAALDELKLGLIDCPDIQTGFLTSTAGVAQGQELSAQRRKYLAKIGRLCSAFVVVSKLNSLHDDSLLQILTTLRDAMPGVPRMLAVNKVKARYAPDVVVEQARGLQERFGISSIFVAYDYRSSLAHSRIPPTPSRWQESDGELAPLFFRADQATDNEAIEYLFDLSDRLDIGALSRESSRSLMLQLKTQAIRSVEWLEKNEQLARRRVQDAWRAISDACYEFMAERDASGRAIGLRLQASPAIVAQMADSLQRTAPSWMRLSLGIDRTVRQLHQAIGNSASRFKILQRASESVTQFTKRFRRGEGAQVMTPQRLAEALRHADLQEALSGVADAELLAGCETAMKRFSEEDQTQLNPEELDQWSRQVWASMSLKDKLRKGTQPLAVVMAPLLAAVLVPIDGGGTAVLVFASTKELLAAAGIAAVMAPMATGGEALGIVHRETPWRQLSDLFALVCDGIGIPRPAEVDLPSSICAGSRRRLLTCSLEPKPVGHRTPLHRWQLGAQTFQELQLSIQQLS